MYKLALLYLVCIIAGFGLANVPTSAIITQKIAAFLGLIGGISIVVFAIALLIIGIKALLNKS